MNKNGGIVFVKGIKRRLVALGVVAILAIQVKSYPVLAEKSKTWTVDSSNITVEKGISDESGNMKNVFLQNKGNGFPYESFDINLGEGLTEDSTISVTWSGKSNNEKTYMYAYNIYTTQWDKLDAEKSVDGENVTLIGKITIKDYYLDGIVKIAVQNGEGYTPAQYTADDIDARSESTTTSPTYNIDDTPRMEYDFTFAIESDTQYYNEDYYENPDQKKNGVYQYQINIHDWLIANRARMNIQYVFNDGDIIDDEPNMNEWIQADDAYQLLDIDGLPYGILAGNHDVGHSKLTYETFSRFFGEARFYQNPWYGESYENNRGHYDLITVGGIDFIMVYMGWGIGDEEIDWINEVLSQYPERTAILNFHEYLRANGELGEIAQRIHDEVVATNENVCMVLSGHHSNSKTTVDTFTNEDGTTRNVYNMLFDYQSLDEGGAGYFRLMHFDLYGKKIIIRTYTSSCGGTESYNYGDYDAKTSENVNEGNSFVIDGAKLDDSEHFVISFEELGIETKIKELKTKSIEVTVEGSYITTQAVNFWSGKNIPAIIGISGIGVVIIAGTAIILSKKKK